MQVFSVHLECANADSHVHILDEAPVFFMMHVFLGNVPAMSVLLCLSKVIYS